MDKNIAIIGCGNLGTAIAKGLLDRGIAPERLVVTRRNVNRLASLQNLGVQVKSDNSYAVKHSDIILLTVKPYNIVSVLTEVKDDLRNGQIIISAATGISLSTIKTAVPHANSVFRAMPNTAADVSQSLTCICTQETGQEEIHLVNDLFNSIGETIMIDESLMEAATVLGACGIAYVLRFIRGMIQGGIEIGFDAQTATTIVSQTVKGAAELLIRRGHHPEHEIDKVTTPRGCTITGLNEMEHNGFSSSLIKGIVASHKKIEV